jgi:hypothetical protein
MTVDEIIKKLNGTYNANKVRAMVDGQITTVAMFVDSELTLTDEGRRALNQADSQVVDVVEVKSARKTKAKALTDLDIDTINITTAVELSDTQALGK